MFAVVCATVDRANIHVSPMATFPRTLCSFFFNRFSKHRIHTGTPVALLCFLCGAC